VECKGICWNFEITSKGGVLAMGKNQWVVPCGDKWAVREEKNKRVTAVFDTKQEAIKRGRI